MLNLPAFEVCNTPNDSQPVAESIRARLSFWRHVQGKRSCKCHLLKRKRCSSDSIGTFNNDHELCKRTNTVYSQIIRLTVYRDEHVRAKHWSLLLSTVQQDGRLRISACVESEFCVCVPTAVLYPNISVLWRLLDVRLVYDLLMGVTVSLAVSETCNLREEKHSRYINYTFAPSIHTKPARKRWGLLLRL